MSHPVDDDRDSSDGQSAQYDANVRAKLEHLLSLTTPPHENGSHHHRRQQQHEETKEEVVLLTAHAERTKEMELHLLECLQDSDDDSIYDTLVDLWMGERGEDACRLLHQMETSCSTGLVVEEQVLRAMTERYSVTEWVEPQSRLAVLLFAKGRYREATDLCHAVLSVKPWHFETAQLLVATWLRRQDFGMAVRAARQFALPPLNDRTRHKRRRQWVAKNRAVLTQVLHQSRRKSEELHHDDLLFLQDGEECQDEYCWA